MNKKEPRSHLAGHRKIELVSLDSIDPPKISARSAPANENIDDLARSIKTNGLLQPISLNKKGKRYEIIFGERRFLAHKHMQAAQIPAEIHNWPDDQVLVARARENQDRKNLAPWDEANYLKRCKIALSLTGKALAKKLGLSEAYISQRINIFEYKAVLQDALKDSKINFSVARELSRIQDDKTLNHYLICAIENGATPAIAKRWADDYNQFAVAQIDYDESNPRQIINEAPISNAVKCHFHGEYSTFQNSKNIWVCKECLTAAEGLIVEEAIKQTNSPG